MTIDNNSAIISIAEYDELRAIKANLDKRKAEIEENADKIVIHHENPYPTWTQFLGKDEAMNLLNADIERLRGIEQKFNEATRSNERMMDSLENMSFLRRLGFLLTGKVTF